MSPSASYFVRIRGKVMGPFGEAQLISLRDRGQFKPFHEVSSDRILWAPASTLIVVFPGRGSPDQVLPAEAVSTDQASSRANPREHWKTKSSAAQESALWFYIDATGVQTGPVGLKVIESFIESSVIGEATMLWQEGMGEWQAASRLMPGRFATRRSGSRRSPKRSTSSHLQLSLVQQEELKNTKLGLLLLLVAGFVGLVCPPIAPVAFLLGMIGVGLCLAAPAPARGPAQVTFYFGLGTGLLWIFWLVCSMFSVDLLWSFFAGIQSGSIFAEMDAQGQQEAAESAMTASLTYLGFLILTFMVATGLFFAYGGMLQHLLKMFAVVTGESGLIKLAGINFIIYCVISGFLVCFFYVLLLLPFLFLNGIAVFSALLMPKIISIIFVMLTFLFFCVAICYIITLVILMQLHSKFTKLSESFDD